MIATISNQEFDKDAAHKVVRVRKQELYVGWDKLTPTVYDWKATQQETETEQEATSVKKGSYLCPFGEVNFCKHVENSVEKFVQKCKLEYKISGLYVINLIIRQLRHQCGSDKEVFAPRFAKNTQVTFYSCCAGKGHHGHTVCFLLLCH